MYEKHDIVAYDGRMPVLKQLLGKRCLPVLRFASCEASLCERLLFGLSCDSEASVRGCPCPESRRC